MPTTPSNPFMEAIAEVLSPYARGDERVGELLAISVGRVLLKAAQRGSDWRSQASKEQLRHIADWLRAAVVNNEAWLENVDDKGRPKKLMKFGSVEQVLQEADKAMLRAAQKLSALQLVDGDEELFAELEDGFLLVRLMTPAALDRETAEMQHCIGNGGYDENLQDGASTYLSLRDRFGKAHATLEIKTDTIIQLQGKQNRPPIRAYLDRLIPFIRKRGYAIDVPVSHLGHVIDIHGGWHDIAALPQGLTVGGDLDLCGTNITILPERLRVGGNLYLHGMSISALPEEMAVGGFLDLGNTGITALPKGLIVGGGINLGNTGITILPEGLIVSGSFNLSNTGITVLPEGLMVGGSLNLSKTSISVLPEGLTVGHYLNLWDTNISALPESIADETKVHCSAGTISAKAFRQMRAGSELSECRASL